MKSSSSSLSKKLKKSIIIFVSSMITISVIYILFHMFFPILISQIYAVILFFSLYIWKETDNLILGISFAFFSYVVLKFIQNRFQSLEPTDLPEIPEDPILPPPKTETDDKTPKEDFVYYDVPYLMKNQYNWFYFYDIDCNENIVLAHQSTNKGYYYTFQFEKVKSDYNSNEIFYTDEAIISTSSKYCPKRYFLYSKDDLLLTSDKSKATVFKLGKRILNKDENVRYESAILAKIKDSTSINYDYVFIITKDRNYT